MESIERQLIERLEVGKKRYGHGVIVNSDTKEWGTPSDSWIDMCVEELLDAVFYIIADYIRKGRESDKSICELELEYKINDDFVNTSDPVKYLLETHDEDDNALIMYIVRNHEKIESPKHHMIVESLLNILSACSQF